MKSQATKATPAQVNLHISRQKGLGERMIGEHDRPRVIELAATIILVVCVFVVTGLGWV